MRRVFFVDLCGLTCVLPVGINWTMATSKGTATKKATKDRPRGRPRQRVTKEDSIHIRLTSEQKERLMDEAARAGLGLSSWLLMLGLREADTREAQRTKADGSAGA